MRGECVDPETNRTYRGPEVSALDRVVVVSAQVVKFAVAVFVY